VRLTIFLFAITTTSMLVATRAEHPLAAPLVPIAHETAPADQPPERSMVGTLDQVDADATEFFVKTTSGKQRFVLQNGATIRQGSKTIKASELASHKGERVKVRYREASGERRAEWIVVASPSSGKAKTASN
jgi:hypothetical protein